MIEKSEACKLHFEADRRERRERDDFLGDEIEPTPQHEAEVAC